MQYQSKIRRNLKATNGVRADLGKDARRAPRTFHLVSCFFGGVAFGAALTYLLDPDRGKRRRALIRDHGARLGHRISCYSGTVARDVANRAQGLRARLSTPLAVDAKVDDDTLTDRVRAAIGREINHAKSLQVITANGTVALSGPILEHEVEALIACVEKVPGVVRVLNELNVHKSAENIPALQDSGKHVLH